MKNMKSWTKSREPETGLKVQEVEGNESYQESSVKNKGRKKKNPGLRLDVQVK